VLEGVESPWDAAAEKLRRMGELFPKAEIELVLDPGNRSRCKGTGYALDCLWSARRAVEETTSYEECVRMAIAFGHDTDTTAAVAGGVAGLIYGREAIPERWCLALRAQPMVAALIGDLA
jgi:hypothetical protein